MVFIPAGSFDMGSNEDYSDEKPVHRVELSSFYMAIYQVTNAQYGKFIQVTGHRKPRYWNNSKYNQPDQPVVGVDWHMTQLPMLNGLANTYRLKPNGNMLPWWFGRQTLFLGSWSTYSRGGKLC